MQSDKIILIGKTAGAVTNSQILAAVTGKCIKINSLVFTIDITGTVKLTTKETTTAITPIFDIVAGHSLVIPKDVLDGQTIETLKSEGLGITTTNGSVAYVINYSLIP